MRRNRSDGKEWVSWGCRLLRCLLDRIVVTLSNLSTVQIQACIAQYYRPGDKSSCLRVDLGGFFFSFLRVAELSTSLCLASVELFVTSSR